MSKIFIQSIENFLIKLYNYIEEKWHKRQKYKAGKSAQPFRTDDAGRIFVFRHHSKQYRNDVAAAQLYGGRGVPLCQCRQIYCQTAQRY